MAGKWILAEHVLERGVEPFRRDLPRDERALREAGGEQRLPDAADRSGAQHRRDAFDDDVDVEAGTLRDLPKRIRLKSAQPILGDGQDGRIDGVGNRRRDGTHRHSGRVF